MNSDIYFLTCKINKINLSCSHTKVAVVGGLLLHSFVNLKLYLPEKKRQHITVNYSHQLLNKIVFFLQFQRSNFSEVKDYILERQWSNLDIFFKYKNPCLRSIRFVKSKPLILIIQLFHIMWTIIV